MIQLLYDALDMTKEQLAGKLMISLSDLEQSSSLAELVHSEGTRPILMNDSRIELKVISELIEKVHEKIRMLASRNLAEVVFNVGPWQRVNDPKVGRIQLMNELEKRAYGKVVMLRQSDGQILTFRIAQANEGFPEIGVVNRLSPIAQKLVPTQVGDEIVLPNKKVCEVIAVFHMERHLGAELTDNRTNFRKMEISRPELIEMAVLNDLLRTLSSWREEILSKLAGEIVEILPAEIPPDIDFDRVSSLTASFYTRTTKAQEDIMNRGSSGLVIVEGVAGSGKTSVALGRVKVLCDSKWHDEDDEAYDNFFEPENSVGFVLSDQLIEYLKLTRDDLYLFNMPIREFHELRISQLNMRDISLGKKYTRSPDPMAMPIEGQMIWVYAADRAISEKFAHWLTEGFAKVSDIQNLSPVQKSFLEIFWSEFKSDLTLICNDLLRGSKIFKIEGIASRIDEARRKLAESLEKRSTWIRVNGEWLPIEKSKQFLIKKAKDGDIIGRRVEKEEWITLSDLDSMKDFEFREIASRSFLGEKRGDIWEPFQATDNPFTGPNNSQLRQAVRNNIRERVVRNIRVTEAYAEAMQDGSFLSQVKSLINDPSYDRQVEDIIKLTSSRLKSKRISDSDIDVLLAIAHLISVGYRGRDERDPISHLREPVFHSTVFIDEVQDFTEIQVFLMAEQASPKRRAVTVVGDFGQQLRSNTVVDIKRCFPRANDTEKETIFLLENKRQSGALADFVHLFRYHLMGDVRLSIFEDDIKTPGAMLYLVNGKSAFDSIRDSLLSIPGNQSIAVICKSKSRAREIEEALRDELNSLYRSTQVSERKDLCRPFFIHFTTALDTKGLEFDNVIVPFFDDFNLDDKIDLNSAYVAISRPKLSLKIFGSPLIVEFKMRPLIEKGILQVDSSTV